MSLSRPPSSFAAAKINLALHVVGQRGDGYHLLDSLVVFADIGDTIEFAGSENAAPFSIIGPFAAGLEAGSNNLVSRAAAAHCALSGTLHPLRLTKRLPIASGLGGGSADAAATLRLLNTVGPPLAARDLLDIATRLGADVPMCLTSKPARAQGIGEVLTPLSGMPALPLLLANPGVAVSTPQVFATLARRDNPPMPLRIPAFADAAAVADWLGNTRNDLQAPAIVAAPAIERCLGAIAALPDCLLARMSGSGATVFGIFPDHASAALAAERLQTKQPGWWVVPTMTGAS